MIPYGHQDVSDSDISAVVEVLSSDWLTQGPTVPRFEQAVADYCGASYGIAVNSSTSALHIACLALGVGPGDWVWTSPNTFVASANCALYCGAKVDFVDIDPRTCNISVERLAEKLEQSKAKRLLPKVVIPVHFAGQPCEMPAIHRLSKEYGFKIVEDASHAIGASYLAAGQEIVRESIDGVKVGSCTHSDITVFSFHPVKIITTGEGGMALTNEAELSEKMSRLRTHGITSKPELMQPRTSGEIWNYQQIDLGFNYRMTDFQAALGLSQLERLNDFLIKRHKIARMYDRALEGLPLIRPWRQPYSCSSYHLYPIRLGAECSAKTSQREAYDKLRAAGIAVNLHYIPVHRQPFYEARGFRAGDFPESELFHRQAMSLPIFPALTEEQQAFVCNELKLLFV